MEILFFRKKCAEQGRWNGGGVSPTCSRSSPSLATSQFANLVICAPTKLRHCFSSPVSLPSLCALFQLFYGPIFCVLPRGGRGGRWNVRRRFATPTPKSQSRRRCLRPKPLFSRDFFEWSGNVFVPRRAALPPRSLLQCSAPSFPSNRGQKRIRRDTRSVRSSKQRRQARSKKRTKKEMERLLWNLLSYVRREFRVRIPVHPVARS